MKLLLPRGAEIVPRADFPGGHAGASLKLFGGDIKRAPAEAFPRRTRRGLIEAG